VHAEAAYNLDHVEFFVEVIVTRLDYLGVEQGTRVLPLAETHHELLPEVL